MSRVYMTGSTGFIGKRTANELTSNKIEVVTGEFDITSYAQTEAFISGLSSGDTIIHLAGLSTPSVCEADPHHAFDVNVAGTLSLCEAIQRSKAKVHLVFASTAHVYGSPDVKSALKESSPINPINCYGRTKRAAEVALIDWAKFSDQSVTVLRIFNHSHKTQSPQFFLPSLFNQALKIKESPNKTCKVGNLELYRDIGSVQDLVTAIRKVVELQWPAKGNARTINVCSGEPKYLRKVAEELFSALEVNAELIVDPNLVRPSEPKTMVGDNTELKRLTGWSPTCVSESDLIRQFLN